MNPQIETIDKIVVSLTTSLSNYQSAVPGTWITITADEYATLQANIESTVIAGISNNLMSSAVNIHSLISFPSDSSAFVRNIIEPNSAAIPSNSYIYAFSLAYNTMYSNSNISVYTSTDNLGYTGYTQLGSILPATYSNGLNSMNINYYLLKTPSKVTDSSNGFLGIYTGDESVGVAPNNGSSWWVGGIHSSGSGFYYELNQPPLSYLIISYNSSDNCTIAMQALTTSIIQWG